MRDLIFCEGEDRCALGGGGGGGGGRSGGEGVGKLSLL